MFSRRGGNIDLPECSRRGGRGGGNILELTECSRRGARGARRGRGGGVCQSGWFHRESQASDSPGAAGGRSRSAAPGVPASAHAHRLVLACAALIRAIQPREMIRHVFGLLVVAAVASAQHGISFSRSVQGGPPNANGATDCGLAHRARPLLTLCARPRAVAARGSAVGAPGFPLRGRV